MTFNLSRVKAYFALSLALILFAIPTLSLFAQDEEDLTLVVLEDGEAYTGVFEDEINAQLYMFLGSAGDTITINMTQSDDSLLDPFLVLMGAAGQVYDSDDDSGDVVLSAEISDFTLPEDGLYFVLATSFTGLRRGVFEAEGEEALRAQFYDITVSGITTPEQLEGEEEFTYFAGEMTVGDEERVEITQDEPVFFINLFASEGDVISITTSDDGSDTPVDTLLYLFNNAGERIAINDDVDDNNLYAAIEDVIIESDELYLIFATGFQFEEANGNGDWAGSGTFLITID